MKVAILTPHLKVEAIGTESWRLLEPLAFRVECDEHPEPFVFAVPGGYDTDFESVPKLIFMAYVLIKGRFKRAATGHDYLIDWIQGEVPAHLQPSLPFRPRRAWIDSFFDAAMLAESRLPGREAQPLRDWLARRAAYIGVAAYTPFTGE